ncbi:MAG: NAD(+)/NADH kinase [Actinomycetota bacterium]|nr:NAD(+)/NADH kinase [Actinomycetota bacterium]
MIRPIALANSKSGDGSEADIAEWCDQLGLESRDTGDDLESALRAAADDRPPFVAVVGGDGTQRAAATLFADRGVTLLPVPGGTRNHFAKALGLADLDDAAAAVTSGIQRDVPLSDLNGEAFLNTAVVGWYPEMVRTRERLRDRYPRPIAAAAALALHAHRLHRFNVEVAGSTHRAWMLWVGNGRFGLTPNELSARADLTDHVLDIRIALAHRRFARARVVWDLVRGRLKGSDHLERFVADGPVVARLGAGSISAALDAEIVTIANPLVFTPASRTVRVLAAPSARAE